MMSTLLSHQLEEDLKAKYEIQKKRDLERLKAQEAELQKQKESFEENKKKENELFRERLEVKLKEEAKRQEQRIKAKIDEEQSQQIAGHTERTERKVRKDQRTP